jgi:pyruvate/2-oxoglutarate dehydrogenase complex dihydrolipoamide dehydrogenase (E3) component
VFLAAGGRPVVPAIEGIDRAVTAEDVLAGRKDVRGTNVVVVGGGVTGLETAETLAPNYKVTVVEMLDKVGGNLYPSITMHLAQEIMKTGGAIAKGKALAKVNEASVTVKDVKTGEESEIPADTVILAMGVRPDRTEADALKAAYGDRLILVGDADRTGQIYDALHSAYDRAFVFAAR